MHTRRECLFLVAVNYSRSAPTCFCVSMNTGPAVSGGADLILTELPDGFVVQVGTVKGGQAISGLGWRDSTPEELDRSDMVPKKAAEQQTRRINPATVHDTLMNSFNGPAKSWSEQACDRPARRTELQSATATGGNAGMSRFRGARIGRSGPRGW